MHNHLSKAVSQINDPALRRVALFGISGAAIILILLSGLAWWLQDTYANNALENLMKGWELWEWLLSLILASINFLSVLSILLVMTVLFPVFATLIIGFLLEDVVTAIEKKHYPDDQADRPQPISEVIGSTFQFTLLVIGLNLLFLPVYLILLIVPPFNLVLYYMLNGYFVGREYFALIAIRQMEPRMASQLRQNNRGKVLIAGIIITFLLTIPIVNILMPVIATAFMVHVFHSLPGRQKALSQATDAH